MRVIVRFSLNNDARSELRNALFNLLTGAGFAWHGERTATYEHHNIAAPQLAQVMVAFWQQAVNPPNQAEIDHVWTYSDNLLEQT